MKVPFLETLYDVEMWNPNEDPVEVYDEPFIAMDTETKLLVPGLPIERAILQCCCIEAKKVYIVNTADIDTFLERIHRMVPDIEWVFHNAPFDLDVLGFNDPKFSWIRSKFEAGQVTDTGIRYVLRAMLDGSYNNQWALDHVAQKLLGIVLAKDEAIRFSFQPNAILSTPQIEYAALDAIATALIRKKMPVKLASEDIQNKGHMVLYHIGRTGLYVDQEYMENLKAQLEAEQALSSEVLFDWGWIPRAAGNDGVFQDILGILEKRGKITFKRTSGGKTGRKKISTSEKDMSLIYAKLPRHPLLVAYKEFKHIEKIIAAYLKKENVAADGRAHPYYSPMKKTGRSSASNPPVQQMPKKQGVRGIYRAPPGHVLVSVDYNQLELCTLAESCYERFGKSKMGDIINSGEDLHSWFGSILYKEDTGIDLSPKEIKKKHKNYRNMSKVVLLGSPGGLGPDKLVDSARSYGITFTREQAKKFKEIWLETFPEMKEHMRPPPDSEWTAKNIKFFLNKHCPGITGISTMEELKSHLSSIGWTDEKIKKETFSLPRYIAEVPSTGRYKKNCTFCACLNLAFQGLAADATKVMLWNIHCAGYKLVNFIHCCISGCKMWRIAGNTSLRSQSAAEPTSVGRFNDYPFGE